MQVEIVPYNKAVHENFVKSYLSTYLSHGLIYDLTPEKRKLLISKIIYTMDSYIKKIAVDSKDPNKFLGFIISEDSLVPNIVFLYIKKEYQRVGIGTLLVNEVNNFIIDEVRIPCKSPNLNMFLKKLNLKPTVRYYEFLEK